MKNSGSAGKVIKCKVRGDSVRGQFAGCGVTFDVVSHVSRLLYCDLTIGKQYGPCGPDVCTLHGAVFGKTVPPTEVALHVEKSETITSGNPLVTALYNY